MLGRRWVWRDFGAVLFVFVFVLAVTSAHARGLWPQDGSDLKPDPTVRFGVLPNGLRYVIKRNANPEGTLSMRMRIDAGSLNETDGERGVAHFLEHMAFNGSENYPEGEMFKALQRMGMQIGSAANAVTDYDSTTFTLSLPSVRNEIMNNGFKIMREIVGRLKLSSDAIDRERGVILSEERARDTPGVHSALSQLNLLFAGQRYATRSPIGELSFIKSATTAQLRSFYERFYRPQRAMLVVVGDADVSALEARIAATFSDWKPDGASTTSEDYGKPKARGIDAAVIAEPGLEETVSINWIQPEDLRRDSRVRRRETHNRIVAYTVMNRRLSKLSRRADPPFIDASVSRDVINGGGVVTSLTVRTKTGEWARGLAAAEQELRRALVHGLQQSEVEREALEQKSPYLLVNANTNTRSNMDVAELIMDSIGGNRVPTDPKTDLDLYSQNIAGIKAAEVTKALKASVAGVAGPLLFLSTSRAPAGGAASVRDAFARSAKVAVAPPPKDSIKEFTYRDFGPNGKVASRKALDDIGATLVRFQNGVMLNIKPTDYEKDKVSIIVRIPGGYLAMPRNKRGLGWIMPFAFVEGGLGRLEMQELEQTEPGHFAGINLDLDEGKFQLSGDTVERDVLLQMQVLAAFMTDAAYRPDGLRRIQSAADGQQQEQLSKATGVLNREILGVVHDGDGRWASPTVEDLRALTMDDIKSAISPSLARAPVEVTIVGHVKVSDAIEAASRTFGALAARDATFKLPDGAANVRFPAKGLTLAFKHAGRADQAAVASVWPGPDYFTDMRQEQSVAVLSEVLQLRLIDEVREAQGGTYTPFGNYWASHSIKGYGYLMAGVEPNPDSADLFFSTLSKITDELRDGELAVDLLDRARKPLLYQLYAAESSNGYWLEALSDAQSDPRNLERVRSAVDTLSSITADDVIETAKRYLDDKRRIDVKVLPK
ncbi:MAG: insulinase family protein [Micropepsaceae bacterium]